MAIAPFTHGKLNSVQGKHRYQLLDRSELIAIDNRILAQFYQHPKRTPEDPF